ncbi:MAG TPA: AI-2E family transporter [Flavobacterium sp.]|jgi:predicted PurR-regulated permease PerM
MKSIPIYRLNAVLLLIILTAVILYFGKTFLAPLFFSMLLVMLLMPVCRKFEKWGIGRIWSTLIGILIIMLFTAAFIGIIAAQAAAMAEDIPKMQSNAEQFLTNTQSWIQSRYGISPVEQISYLKKGIGKASQSGGQFFGAVLTGTFGLLTGFVLVLLYFFFLMWKREKYRSFILKLVKEESRSEVSRELNQINSVAGKYLIGRMISMVFLAVFYMIGFSVVGLENGILVALVAVVPTIVPYVGAFIGGFFPIALALVTGSSEMVVPVVIILVIAQVIDNNIIEPLAEGQSLGISPIWTIVAIVLGELVWGVAGMILFIPMFAIVKIICDHIPALSPYSFLLGNEVGQPQWVEKIRKAFTTKKK